MTVRYAAVMCDQEIVETLRFEDADEFLSYFDLRRDRPKWPELASLPGEGYRSPSWATMGD